MSFSLRKRGFAMERSRKHSIPVLFLALAGALMAAAIAPAETDETAGPTAADEIRAAVPDVRLSLLLDDVLNRNPRLARLTAEAAAAAQRAPSGQAAP